MAPPRNLWYYSNMSVQSDIPAFGLYGEVHQMPDVVHCETFSARAPLHDWKIVPHRHSHMSQLFIISRGALKCHVDDQDWELSDNTFLYVPELSVHALDFKPDTEGLVISFPTATKSSIAPNTQKVLSALSDVVFGTETPLLITQTETLRIALEESTEFRATILVGLAHSILATIANAKTNGLDGSQPIKTNHLRQLDALISSHLGKGWGASDYAQAMSISTGHLGRVCREHSGLGTTAYIERRVMTEACRMLAFTQMPVSEIGYRLGFDDPSYFSKRFNKCHHQTPTRYRAAFTK